ncbi:MAG TPA: S41 family peptidase [Burkholderiales bacterium]|nr:S41 family peptidase [Burkholderiales bacterium]
MQSKLQSKLRNAGLVLLGAVAGVLISLNFQAIADRAGARTSLPIEELRAFTDVFGAVKTNYVEPVEDKKLITEAINGMLTGLDPHSAYLDAEAFKELQVGTQGQFGGLGIEVGMEDGFVKVISPIEDTPAFRAGIKPGDLIIKLDDTPVKGMTLNDAVKRMRGKPNTSITLTISRKGETAPVVVQLTRAVIRVQSVKSKLIEPGYAWVRVSQFQEQTPENLVKHLEGVFKQGPVKGLVLDLRNDPGGLLHGAVAISAAFLPQKALVVSTEGRAEDAKRKFFASPEDYARRGDDVLKALPPAAKTVPMVVLVNGGSASASEIVAGALQDHKRAKVLGTQTFGKGSVQTIMPLGNSTAIKLTTARYYTPNGRSIQALGVTPDMIIEDPNDKTTRVREADLSRHLENGRETKPGAEAKPAPEVRTKPPAVVPGEQKPTELGSKDDFQLAQAIAFLKGEPVKGQQAPTPENTKPAGATAPKSN